MKEYTEDKCSKALNKVPDPEEKLLSPFSVQHKLFACLGMIYKGLFIFKTVYFLPSDVYTSMLHYASLKCTWRTGLKPFPLLRNIFIYLCSYAIVLVFPLSFEAKSDVCFTFVF